MLSWVDGEVEVLLACRIGQELTSRMELHKIDEIPLIA